MIQDVAIGSRRLAHLLRERRVDCGYATARALAEKTKLSERVINDLENAKRSNYSERTLFALDDALRLKRGSAQRVLSGEGDAVFLPLVSGEIQLTSEKSAPDWIPSGVLEGLSEAEQAEVRAAAVDAAFVRAREIRSSRPTLTGEAPTHANWEPHTDRFHAQAN